MLDLFISQDRLWNIDISNTCSGNVINEPPDQIKIIKGINIT